MKIIKIKTIITTLVITALSGTNYYIRAYENNTSAKIVEERYEKELKVSQKKYRLDENTDIPKEARDDINSLHNIKYLKKKTNSKYEIALAYENGEYIYLQDTDNLDQAIKVANETQQKTRSIATPVVINEYGLVTYTTGQSIGRIVKIVNGVPVESGDSNYQKYTVKVYKTATSKNDYTYMNHSFIDDVPIIENNGIRSKIQVNGFIGWIDNEDVEGLNIISVPLKEAINLSYFTKTENGSLSHYISTDIQTSGKGYIRNIGVAPHFIEIGKKYYSFDGVYFYTDITQLITDLQENTNVRSINVNEPYYNYYTYLPLRHKSIYSVEEINNYLNNNTQIGSVLRNKGEAFIAAQEKYGVSANTMIGIAMNESAKGTSRLAKEKNNIFGLNAIDISPGQSADYFPSIEDCIENFAKNWMHNQYLNPKSWKFFGSNLGNKMGGINVKYASDPYWGEKASDFIYNMDRYISGGNQLKEHNRYQLGIYVATDNIKDSNGNTLYDVLANRNYSSSIGDPLVVLSNDIEKIQLYPDRVVPMTEENPITYDWNKKAYVKLSTVKYINNYSIQFNSQGGSAVAIKAAQYNSTIAEPTRPVRVGYTFGGWYKESACINPWNFTTDKITKNTVLYAKWNINSYTVSFNSQGGSTVATKTATYNSLITEPTKPTRLGYNFAGWYKEYSCVNQWNFTTNKVTNNTTLYAKWNKITVSTPSNFKGISSGYNSIKLSWSPVYQATGYEIYRSTSSTGSYTLISNTTSSSYNNANLQTGKTYYYKIRAYRTIGTLKIYSGYTSLIGAKPILATPTNLIGKRISPTSIKLTWKQGYQSSGYEIYRSTSSTGTYTLATRTSNLYFTNNRLIYKKGYYYKIRSYKIIGKIKIYSGYSNLVFVK